MARTWKKLATGIYEDARSIQAVVNCAAGRKTRRFPHGTPLREIKQWRNGAKVRLEARARTPDALTAKLPSPPAELKGWRYLYVIAGGLSVKIGVARNPHQRLKELQTGHDFQLELLATAPAHVALEPALHQRFAHVRMTGEWFQLTSEIARFIEDLRAGRNPALWLW